MTMSGRWRWTVPALVVLVWLLAGGAMGPFAGRLGQVSTNDQAAFLPGSAESTEVNHLREDFQKKQTVPLVVVWVGDPGPITPAQRGRAARALREAARVRGAAGPASPALPSKDGRALQAVVPLRGDLGDEVGPAVDAVREAAGRVEGTRVHLSGPAATQADLSEAFAGIDGILLAVALSAVLLILVVVYRSVLLPLVVILTAVFALALASAVVYALADHGAVRVDGQVQGILFILVIGAATDYALLLTARFREELGGDRDRWGAIRVAWRRSVGAVTASAATVALGLLTLLISDLTNNRALGPVGAIGVLCAVAAALTFLPAALVLLGRAAYWPARPRPVPAVGPRGDGPGNAGLWGRVAGLVDRRPRRIWVSTTIVLAAFAAFFPVLHARGIPLDEIFINDAPSVTGQQALARHFPAGSGNPVVVITRADRTEQVLAAVRGTEGVAQAAPVTKDGQPGGGAAAVVDGRARIDATLSAAADSDAAKETVPRLRDAVHGVDGARALVGGYTAEQYDTQQTAAHDRTLIIPVVLAVILCILVALLRSLLLPLLLVASVALNYLATLGVTALLFTHVFGFSGTDASVPLYGFVFLVALGVDYNIFLMTRVREEARRHGNRTGILTGLSATGGVITSAGIVLAATFAALTVIPLAFLAQIAFIVAFGVLLDTLVVRSLLVPALVRHIGPAVWWPHRGIRP
ncbi:MMPL family transporter [Streptomyces sp. TG1A-8]|uniref:MMPL family transporter n=1 Tax=Streptomyces sp. TG1A-8 TaxID=3051385 RepID=UPI00265BF3CA|nr:MMPL family transporter [Streptomyces sp. TG1A-8]MDO0929052.1 MMPL family transporter [Streptomyces sp. TG1A-8]